VTTALSHPGTTAVQHDPTPKKINSATLSLFKGEDMARRRGQKNGHLYKKGPSWILRWREDVRTASGDLQRGRFSRTIGPATGPDKLTRKEAERQAWSEVLEKLDNVTIHPQSLATVKEFVSAKFEPEWIWALKPAGKKHYMSELIVRTKTQ
jgi:hypothetical protein